MRNINQDDFNTYSDYEDGYHTYHYGYDRRPNEFSDQARQDSRDQFRQDDAEHRRMQEYQNQVSDNNRSFGRDYAAEERTSGYSPGYRSGYSNNYGRLQRSSYGRANYAVPGLEPGDPNFGKQEHEWSRMPYGTGRNVHHSQYDQNYGSNYYENHDRTLFSQAGDEIRSWFGDREAARRRQMDSHHSLHPEQHNHYQSNQPNDYNRNFNHDQNRW